MNGINWTHLLTLTLSPEKGSNGLKNTGTLSEALPMGIITYLAMAILTYILACITTSIVGYKFFTIFSFTTLLGLIFKGLLKAIIPALLASYIFNFYCQRTYPTVNVNLPDTIKQFMYGVGVFAVLTLVQNIIFVPFMMSLYTNTLPSGLVRTVIFILNMCTYGWTAFTLLKLCIAEYNMSVRDTATTLVVSIVPLIVINYIIKNIFVLNFL